MDLFDEVDYRELHPHDLAMVEPTLRYSNKAACSKITKGKIFRMNGVDWFVREVSVLVFPDGVTRVGCWCYAFDKHGNDPPKWEAQHWCVPCDDLTIRMLKAEAAKGHCFLGFKKEVHHEFNY